MEYKTEKKAWSLDWSLVANSYRHLIRSIVYADTEAKAKKKIFKQVKYDFILLKEKRQRLDIENIPVKRDENEDLVQFEGLRLPMSAVKKLLIEKSRIEELRRILHDESISYVYIMDKDKDYYTGLNFNGFSENRFYAGIYKKKLAVDYVQLDSSLIVEPCSSKEHSKHICMEQLRIIKAALDKCVELEKFKNKI